MKQINKKVFIISVMCAIITIIIMCIYLNNGIRILSLDSQENFQSAQNLTQGEVDDVEGYGAIIKGGAGFLGLVGAVVLLIGMLMIIGINILYTVLYLISWLIHKKKETKARIIISAILIVLSILIQIWLVKVILSIYIIDKPILLLITLIAQIISILFIIIYYIINMKKLKQLYKSIEQEGGKNDIEN